MDRNQRELIRSFAHRKWSHELQIKRLADARSWTPEQPDWREYAEPELLRCYDDMAAEIKLTLKAHRSKANHPALARFTEALATHAVKSAAFGDGGNPAFEDWGDAWEVRFRNAGGAVRELSRTLQNMGDDERQHWLPPRYVAKEAGAGDEVECQQAQLEEWLTMTHAIAGYFNWWTDNTAINVKTASNLAPCVWLIARDWADYFEEIPGAAENSPFTAVVQRYITTLFPASKPPTHPNIADALNRIKPKLEEHLHRKKSQN